MTRRDDSSAAGMPPAAAVPLLADRLAVAIVRNNCAGYWLVTRCNDEASAAALIAAINIALGVSPPQREAMAAGSMFGYACPAADPLNYDDAGHMLRQAISPDDTRTEAAH